MSTEKKSEQSVLCNRECPKKFLEQSVLCNREWFKTFFEQSVMMQSVMMQSRMVQKMSVKSSSIPKSIFKYIIVLPTRLKITHLTSREKNRHSKPQAVLPQSVAALSPALSVSLLRLLTSLKYVYRPPGPIDEHNIRHKCRKPNGRDHWHRLDVT